MKELLKKIVVKILIWEARIALLRYRPFIIGITGSVGKTSAKDAMYALMQPHFQVRKSQKSFNSEFGIPLTILGLPNAWNNHFEWLANLILGFKQAFFTKKYPKYLVLEIGADSPGDIKSVTKWLKPRVAVITRFPEVPVHIEFFNSKEEVIEEKSALAKAVGKDGLLILNRDDEKVYDLRKEAEKKGTTVLTFGEHEESDVRLVSFSYTYGENEGVLKPIGMSAIVSIKENTYTFRLNGTVNKNHILAFLPGIAFLHNKNISLDGLETIVESFVPPPGRMTILSGVQKTTLLDDSYNASPIAVSSALETLRDLEVPTRKIAVLGDMMELGRFTEEEHRKIGSQAARAVDVLLTIGVRSRFTHEEAMQQKKHAECVHVESIEKAISYLQENILPGDLILFKGSQSSRLEKVVKEFLVDKAKAHDLLARQDEEWEKR